MATARGTDGGWRWRAFAFGFVYWFVFVLVLEPGNVLRALQDGVALPVGRELLRLAGAGLLGATITPLVFALARAWPVEGEAWRNRGLLHAGADAALAVALIVAAGLLAWLLRFDRRPLGPALGDQLAVDGLLLFFAVAALDGIAHAALLRARAQSAAEAPAAPASGYLTMISVKDRGRVAVLDLGAVGWIEAQGNYLALHAGTATHLIRETLARLESKLDPARFVRIHRGTIVDAARIRAIAPLAGGDATVTLDDGTPLRMSRSFREAVKARIEHRAG